MYQSVKLINGIWCLIELTLQPANSSIQVHSYTNIDWGVIVGVDSWGFFGILVFDRNWSLKTYLDNNEIESHICYGDAPNSSFDSSRAEQNTAVG